MCSPISSATCKSKDISVVHIGYVQLCFGLHNMVIRLFGH